ncbi:CWC16 protein [Triangularia verruculosa]|uniref:Splicing factor YJU2 n=1 Tax=Triangularia verruculosa TaxID=2587418 RepID=A0AAN6XNW2_9PEZI|nr:CWC16 protein [Triangularia verruculosa]
MSERKVLSKYYPPDFDPSLVGRTRKPKSAANTPKVQVVRLMAPFSMRCTACGEYMYRGRKFNARKETRPDERYLSIQIYRFYIRCTRCSAEIVFKTDPKNQDYLVEQGAKRNTDPWKRGLEDGAGGGEDDETDEQRLDRLEREMAEAAGEEEKNAMAELEQKTEDAKREMAVADALDEIRSRNARLEKAKSEGADLLEGVVSRVTEEERERQRQEEEDAEAARRAFQFARRQEMLEEIVEEDEEVVGETAGAGSMGKPGPSSSSVPTKVTASTAMTTATTDSTDMPPPSFKRVVKRKKDHGALLGIKKKKIA